MDHRTPNHLLFDGPGDPPPSASESYRALIEHLYSLARGGMAMGLVGIGKALADLGHPELAFRTVHIAGSNGKGSTSAFLASILSAKDRRPVGLFTSPHLISLTERIQFVEGTRPREITTEDLTEAIFEVKRVAPAFKDLTFFEVITAAGMVAMKRGGVGTAVIEAGLGARLDATRLVGAEVAVLTDLSLEHTAILGDTIEEIAREEASVVRPERPLIAADGPAAAVAVIEAMAAEVGAPLSMIGRDLHLVRHPDGTFDFDLGDRQLSRARLSLLGPHQGRNALLAIKAATTLEPTLTDEAIRRGLENAVWPGRMEIFRREGQPPMVLDGAHNPAGAETLVAALRAHRELFDAPLHFVFGVLSDKDVRAMLETLEPVAASLTLTRPASVRARDPAELSALVSAEAAARTQMVELVPDALEAARARAEKDNGWVVVCGSLYLVGEARALLLEPSGP